MTSAAPEPHPERRDGDRLFGEKPPPEHLPLPTAHFRRRAWLEFQRALDPLAPATTPRRPPR